MLSFSRKTEYALIALAHLWGDRIRVISAREIAETHGLPQPLMMKILKTLHQAGILLSSRGVKGGYMLAVELNSTSLYDLMQILRAMDAAPDTPANDRDRLLEDAASLLPTEGPLAAVQSKLMRFLKDVKLSDLIRPGHRIDVPVEQVGLRRIKNNPTATALVG
jgi:Rrf2 family protein